MVPLLSLDVYIYFSSKFAYCFGVKCTYWYLFLHYITYFNTTYDDETRKLKQNQSCNVTHFCNSKKQILMSIVNAILRHQKEQENIPEAYFTQKV